MSASLHQFSVAAFERALTAFLGVLGKAEAHAGARKFNPDNYLGLRLAPDQFPFVRQVQIFCDHAKNGSFRLASVEAPRLADDEATLAALRARIETTLGLLRGLDPASVDAGAEREIVFPIGPDRKVRMPGASYLAHFALPNFYFHLTTAYDILRAAGVDVGKRDYLGTLPDLSPA